MKRLKFDSPFQPMLFIRILLFIVVFFAGSVYAFGQSGDKASQSPKVKQPLPEKVEIVEEIDGVWELSGYLGNKLMDEMRNRLNLDESKTKETTKTKRIKINIGPFKFERIEPI